MNEKESQRIESLKQRLESRTDQPEQEGRSRLRERRSPDVARDWAHEHAEPPRREPISEKKKRTLAKRIFVGAILFFIAAAGIAAFILLGGNNLISSQNIDITITGPSTVAGGEELDLDIAIINNNNVELEDVSLTVVFPPSTRNPENVQQTQERVLVPLESIAVGERVRESVAGVVFGREGDTQEVLVTVEYRVRGSNAIFAKERLYEYEIVSAPLSLRVEMPSEINSGQEVPIQITVTSNATDVIQDVLVTAAYPFGFDFVSATPEPSSGEETWALGDMPPESVRTINVIGTLEGQDEEERTFTITTGIEDEGSADTLGVVFLTEDRTVAIARSFIALSVVADGKAGQTVTIESGEQINVSLSWENNLSVPLSDAEITARLEGIGLDEDTIRVTNGFYDSQTNTITWDERSLSELSRIDPGESGTARFNFDTVDFTVETGEVRPTVTIDTAMAASREEGDVSGIVEAESSMLMRLATDLLLTSRGVHFVGPFTNTGPMPPEAEESTTYTILWEVTNSTNEVNGARVSAVLPPYMEWLGEVSPGSETVTFNESARRITWEVGTIDAGVGYTSSPQAVAFQVQLTPSTSQVGTTPILVESAQISGTDAFTGATVGVSRQAVTTNLLTSDPSFDPGMDRIVE